jgi:ribonuclease P protein component
MAQSLDFERVLATPGCAKSPHFALHFLDSVPAPALWALRENPEFAGACSKLPPSHVCYGLVVPKRYARRAVTRNLLKRQIRQTLQTFGSASLQTPKMRNGMWVVRLRSSFDIKQYRSGASKLLQDVVARELNDLFMRLPMLA